MAKTLIRNHNVADSNINQRTVENGYVDLQNQQLINGAKTFNKAVITAPPVEITSNEGIITLTNDSNIFIVNGTEDIISIIGWTSGEFTIQWNTSRKVKYVSGQLELYGGTDKDVIGGDISTFVILNGKIKETSTISRITQPYAYCTEMVATDDVTMEILIPTTPSNKNYVLLSINGILQNTNNFSIGVGKIILTDALHTGDEVKIFYMDTISSDAIEQAVQYGANTAKKYALIF